jgi:uncharacterized membrane protein
VIDPASPLGPDHKVERLVFFSDAVFAIAITLLVIEIKVPHLQYYDNKAALSELLGLWPSFFGFALSFLVIGQFWARHHTALSGVKEFAPQLIWPNLLLLMSVAFMPFATAFMAQNIGHLIPMAFYNTVLLGTALLSWRMANVAYDRWPAGCISEPELLALRLKGFGVALGAASALAVAFVTPFWCQLALLSMPIWQRIMRYIVGRRRQIA